MTLWRLGYLNGYFVASKVTWSEVGVREQSSGLFWTTEDAFRNANVPSSIQCLLRAKWASAELGTKQVEVWEGEEHGE